jgi:hypothetical protein
LIEWVELRKWISIVNGESLAGMNHCWNSEI